MSTHPDSHPHPPQMSIDSVNARPAPVPYTVPGGHGREPGQTGVDDLESTQHPASSKPRRCPNCGSMIVAGRKTCPDCGVQVQAPPKVVRCRHCGKRASSEFVLCPQCGRELRQAPSRLLTWGLPGIVVFLLVLSLANRWEAGNLASWVQRPWGNSITLQIDPAMPAEGVVQITPVSDHSPAEPDQIGMAGQREENAGAQPLAQDPQPETALQEQGTTPIPEEAGHEISGTETQETVNSAVVETAPAVVAVESPEPASTPEPASAPDGDDLAAQLSAAVAAASEATATVTATATAQGGPDSETVQTYGRAYQVQAGDTIGSIAQRFGISTNALLRANGLTLADAPRIQIGQRLTVPSESGDGTMIARTYQVQAGDTPVGIAQRLGIPVEDLLAANGLTAASARTLRLGQVLNIPEQGTGPNGVALAGGTDPSTLAPQRYTIRQGDTIVAIGQRFGVPADDIISANGLSAADLQRLRPGQVILIPGLAPPSNQAPANPASTPAPPATPTAYRLDAPELLNPEPNAHVQCSAGNIYTVRWTAVTDKAVDDEYVLFLGFVDGPAQENGEEPVTQVLAQRLGDQNSWKADGNLCNLAPQEYGRRWRWYVQIFNGETPVSPPSAMRLFSWY